MALVALMSYAQTLDFLRPIEIIGSSSIAVPLVWPIKDPLQVTTRAVNFAPVAHNRVPMSASVSADANQVIILQSVTRGPVVSVRLAGGTDKNVAEVDIRLFFSDGTDEACRVLLPIVAQITITPENDPVAVVQITTTNGVQPGVLGPIPIMAGTGASVSLRGVIEARNANGSDTASWDVFALLKNVNTLAPTVQAQNFTAYTADPTMDACQLMVIPAIGGAVTIGVIGMPSLLINWIANLTWTAV